MSCTDEVFGKSTACHSSSGHSSVTPVAAVMSHVWASTSKRLIPAARLAGNVPMGRWHGRAMSAEAHAARAAPAADLSASRWSRPTRSPRGVRG
jgi:hypothetical protein